MNDDYYFKLNQINLWEHKKILHLELHIERLDRNIGEYNCYVMYQNKYGIHTWLDRNLDEFWYTYMMIRPTSNFWLNPPLVPILSLAYQTKLGILSTQPKYIK
jgi:hypothetical protein